MVANDSSKASKKKKEEAQKQQKQANDGPNIIGNAKD